MYSRCCIREPALLWPRPWGAHYAAGVFSWPVDGAHDSLRPPHCQGRIGGAHSARKTDCAISVRICGGIPISPPNGGSCRAAAEARIRGGDALGEGGIRPADPLWDSVCRKTGLSASPTRRGARSLLRSTAKYVSGDPHRNGTGPPCAARPLSGVRSRARSTARTRLRLAMRTTRRTCEIFSR